MVDEELMSELLQRLESAVEVGCAYRGSLSVQSWQRSRQASGTPLVWRSLYEAYQLTRQHQLPGDEMCWHFPGSSLLAVSHDRLTLGALLRPRPTPQLQGEVLSTLRETLAQVRA